MGKKVAIVQSSYIPWKGYFDLINSVDEFILFDDVQYTRRDWRNRNRIRTYHGSIWLTIPVEVKGRYLQKIKDTQICDPTWNKMHLRSILSNYSRARFFKDFSHILEELYLGASQRYLSEINYRFTHAICQILGITTKISWSMDFSRCEGKSERLLGLCKQTGGTEYISGPSAKAYIDESLFHAEGIDITYFDYSGYPEYVQVYPPFEHSVSIIDLILNTGPEAPRYMKSFGVPTGATS